MKKITYYENKIKKIVQVEIMDTPWKKFKGLMFQKRSPPLLFIFNKNKKLSIHSLFCQPFKAIWLDEKMNATKILDVKTWKLNISGHGKYLLEIPLPLDNNKIPVENR